MVAILESGRKNIVILGAGFGGITALLTLYYLLRRHRLFPTYNLVLVSKSRQHLYTPALYEIASLPRGQADAVCLKSTICIQIEDIVGRFPEIKFFGETVLALDPERHVISFASGNSISFEYAVLALGAESNYFGIPGLAECACTFKTFEDAVRMRNRAEELLRPASMAPRIVIGGGGATGVELAAEFRGFLNHLAPGQGSEVAITIVEASPRILGGFKPEIAAAAERRLARLGVGLATGTRISHVTPANVVLADSRVIPYDLLVWAGGVAPAGVIKSFGLSLDRRGGIIVNEFLEARARIYALGDNASFIDPKTGRLLPGNVPVAEAEARAIAKNVVAAVLGKRQKPFRPLAEYPFILAVGGKYALTDLVIIRLSGLAGWVLKQLVELRYLLFVLPRSKAIPMWLRAVYYGTAND